jgi:hypothetical protein
VENCVRRNWPAFEDYMAFCERRRFLSCLWPLLSAAMLRNPFGANWFHSASGPQNGADTYLLNCQRTSHVGQGSLQFHHPRARPLV